MLNLSPRFLRSTLVPLVAFVAATAYSAPPTNLALGRSATGSTEGYGSIFQDAVDGNRNGAFGGGSVWHSLDPDSGLSFLTVDLGSTSYLDHLTFFPRTDARQLTMINFRLSVFADNGGQPGATVWTQNFYTTGTRSADGTATAPTRAWSAGITAGTTGRFVKIERLSAPPNFLTFAEMEVWGSATPLPTNLARTATVRASSAAAFSSALAAVNDGNLGADYVNQNSSIYHSQVQGIGQSVTLELAANSVIDYVQLFPRSDGGLTTTNFRVSLWDAGNNLLVSQDSVFAAGFTGYETVVDFDSVANARYVTVETLNNEFLALGEVGVFGAVPEPGAVGCMLSGLGLLFSRRRRA